MTKEMIYIRIKKKGPLGNIKAEVVVHRKKRYFKSKMDFQTLFRHGNRTV